MPVFKAIVKRKGAHGENGLTGRNQQNKYVYNYLYRSILKPAIVQAGVNQRMLKLRH